MKQKQTKPGHEHYVLMILSDRAPGDMTLREITAVFNERTGLNVSSQSLCAPLNTLKARGEVTDDHQKRRCAITGVRKKTWSAVWRIRYRIVRDYFAEQWYAIPEDAAEQFEKYIKDDFTPLPEGAISLGSQLNGWTFLDPLLNPRLGVSDE